MLAFGIISCHSEALTLITSFDTQAQGRRPFAVRGGQLPCGRAFAAYACAAVAVTILLLLRLARQCRRR